MVLEKCIHLLPKMVTAADVIDQKGNCILKKGEMLKDTTIKHLLYLGIDAVYVEEDSHADRVRASQEYKDFCEVYEQELVQFEQLITTFLQQDDILLDAQPYLEMVSRLLEQAGGNIPLLDFLHNMRRYDDVVFAHSMNVALISYVLAEWLKWSEEDRNMVALCGMLHDIGKLGIPKELLQRPGKLLASEYQIVQGHALQGYRFLRGRKAPSEICQVALMHHERCDGTGYPMGLVRDNISSFAKLVMIADVYDAMTASRPYRGVLPPFCVVEMFEEEGLQKYETEYLQVFLEHITDGYIRNRVRLSNGTEGEIVMIQKDHLARPLLQCGDEFLDLREHPELDIICIL